jgi:hypothetical protein
MHNAKAEANEDDQHQLEPQRVCATLVEVARGLSSMFDSFKPGRFHANRIEDPSPRRSRRTQLD